MPTPEEILGTTVNIDATQATNALQSAQDAQSGLGTPAIASVAAGTNSSADEIKQSQLNRARSLEEAAAELARRRRADADAAELRLANAKAKAPPVSATPRVSITPVARDQEDDSDYDTPGIPLGATVYEPASAVDADRARTAAFNADAAQQAAPRKSKAQIAEDVENTRAKMRFDVQEEMRNASPTLLNTSAYDMEVKRRYVDAGVARGAEAEAVERANFFSQFPSVISKPEETGATKQDMMWAWGFGGMQTLSAEARALRPLTAGSQYLPGQVQEQVGSAALPLVGSVAGTMIGAKYGQGMAGQFVGGAVGSLVESVADQWYDTNIAVPTEAGQRIGAGRGGDASIDEFVSALRSVATPALRELAESATRASRSGILDPGGMRMMGSMQYQLGFASDQTFQGVQNYLDSSPLLARERAQWGSGTISPDQLFAQSQVAFSQGNYSGGLDLNAAALARQGSVQTVRGIGNATSLHGFAQAWHDAVYGTPDQQRNRGMGIWQAAEEDVSTLIGGSRGVPPTAAQEADAKRKAEIGNSLFQSYQDSQSSLLIGRAAQGEAQSRIGDILARGGGASDVSGLMPGFADSLQTSRRGYEANIARDQALMRRFRNDPAVQQQETVDIASQRAAEAGTYAAYDTQARNIFMMREGETQANYGSSASSSQLALTRGLLSGRTHSQLADVESSLLGNQSALASFLMSEAHGSNPLNPQERAQLATQSRDLQSQVAQQRYSWRMQGYDENLGQADVGIARSQSTFRRAELFGGASDLSTASTDVVSSFTAQIRELTSELQKGGLTIADRITKERELSTATQNLTQAQYQAIIAPGERSIAIGGYGASASQNQFGMDVARYGTGAQSATDLRSSIADYQQQAASARALANTTGIGAEGRAKYLAQASGFDRQAFQSQIALGTVTLDPSRQALEMQTQGSLQRMSSSFMEPGNVNDLRMSAFSQITQDLANFTAQIKRNFPNGVPDEVKPYVEQQRQDLLTRQADLAHEADSSYFQRLPSLTVGGTSFRQRYLPSPSQTAYMLEHSGHGSLAVRNFGFYDHTSFDAVNSMPGSGLLTGGKDWGGIMPGNMSLAAIRPLHPLTLASEHHPVTPSIAHPLASTSSSPVLVKLDGGSIVINITMPDGSRRTFNAPISAAQKVADTSGMGSHFPGTTR